MHFLTKAMPISTIDDRGYNKKESSVTSLTRYLRFHFSLVIIHSLRGRHTRRTLLSIDGRYYNIYANVTDLSDTDTFWYDTVQDEILARVIFGEIVQSTFWWIKYWQISHTCIHTPMQEYYWQIKYGKDRPSPKFTLHQYCLLYGILICIFIKVLLCISTKLHGVSTIF